MLLRIDVSHKAVCCLHIGLTHGMRGLFLSTFPCFVAIVNGALLAEATPQDSFGNGHLQRIKICFNFHRLQAHARVSACPCLTQATARAPFPVCPPGYELKFCFFPVTSFRKSRFPGQCEQRTGKGRQGDCGEGERGMVFTANLKMVKGISYLTEEKQSGFMDPHQREGALYFTPV